MKKYLIVVQDKNGELSSSIVNSDSLMAAMVMGEEYVFGMNDGKLSTQDGYSVLAVIGEHPNINWGVKA